MAQNQAVAADPLPAGSSAHDSRLDHIAAVVAATADAGAVTLDGVVPGAAIAAGAIHPEAGLAGCPKGVVEDLTARIPAGRQSGWGEVFPALKSRSDARRDGVDVDPLLACLRNALPAEAVVSFDVCLPGFLSRKDWYAWKPGCYMYPGVYVGMGFGLPAGIGAQIACPDRPVCVVSGDGGFQMTMAELGTAAQQRLPVVVVVVNDAGLTLIRRVQDRDFGGRRCEVDLANPDFAALARAYGITARTETEPDGVGEAVRRAVERRELTLIEYNIR